MSIESDHEAKPKAYDSVITGELVAVNLYWKNDEPGGFGVMRLIDKDVFPKVMQTIKDMYPSPSMARSFSAEMIQQLDAIRPSDLETFIIAWSNLHYLISLGIIEDGEYTGIQYVSTT